MRWVLSSHDPALVSQLSREAELPPLIAQLLIARGIRSAAGAQAFLHPQITHLHSPYLMRGMKAAVERLQRAIAQREPVLIYGDYDVDGTVAIVILKTALELCGGQADFHVPHRIRDGYGMKQDVIEQAAAAGVRLIISVDTGIRAFAAAETAARCGVDLIVTDHHLAEAGNVPKAFAVLNPNQPGCEYPCKELCGAGVAFKVAQALLEAAGRSDLLPSFLKMVAIATVSDAVPLTAENRVITKLGLEGLRYPVNPGLKALLEAASLTGRRLGAGDIGFRIGPRLNAAGRMDVAADVIELFTTREPARARELALKLNRLNADRQEEEARVLKHIEEFIAEDPARSQPYCLVLHGEDWHRGVIGIVATRVVERYGRPALVVSCDASSGEAHGSGRSIPAFHLLNALEDESCRHLFTRFGGHAHAVGFSLPSANLSALASALDGYARSRLQPSDFEPALELDAELDLAAIDGKLFRLLEQLEPFGIGNREPAFVARGARLKQPPQIMKERHFKLRIGSNGQGRCFDALGWRMAERLQSRPLSISQPLDLAFNIEDSSNHDFPGLQLRLRDYAPASLTAATAQPN